jgi:hypothetical protein
MPPNAALLAMHEAARERGEDPMALTPVTVVGPSGPSGTPAPEFRIEQPNWDQVRREEAEAEREARIREAAALLETVEPPPQPDSPAPKTRWRRP